MNVCLHCQFPARNDGDFCPSCGSSLRTNTASSEQLQGSVIAGKYTLEKQVKITARFDVYQANFNELDQTRVLLRYKAPISQTERNEGFLRSLQNLCSASQQHQGLTVHYEADFAENFGHFVAREYLNGAMLASYLQPGNPLFGVAKACGILLQVSSALQTLHDNKIIFNGLDPYSIMLLNHLGQEGKIKLLDIGLGRPLNGLQPNATPPYLQGSMAYLAPEQLFPMSTCKERGWALDHRLDIYAMGVLGYKLLTGRVPFRRKPNGLIPDDWSALREALETTPPPPLEIAGRPMPLALNDLIMRALQLDPNNRPESAAAFTSELLEATKQLRQEGDDAAFTMPKSKDPNKRTGAYPIINAQRIKVTDSGDPESKDARVDQVEAQDNDNAESEQQPLPELPETLTNDNIADVVSWSQLFDEEIPATTTGYTSDELTDSFQLSPAEQAALRGEPQASPPPAIAAPQQAPLGTPFGPPTPTKAAKPAAPAAPTFNVPIVALPTGNTGKQPAFNPNPSPFGQNDNPKAPPPPPGKTGPPPAPVKAGPPAPPSQKPPPRPTGPNHRSGPFPKVADPLAAPDSLFPEAQSSGPRPTMRPGPPPPGQPQRGPRQSPRPSGPLRMVKGSNDNLQVATDSVPTQNPLNGPSLEFALDSEQGQSPTAQPPIGAPQADFGDASWDEADAGNNKKPIIIIAILGLICVVGSIFFFMNGDKKEPANGKKATNGRTVAARTTDTPKPGVRAANPEPTKRTEPTRPAPTRPEPGRPAPRAKMDFGGDRPQPRTIRPRPVRPRPVRPRPRRIARRRVIRRRTTPPRRRPARRRSKNGCSAASSPSKRAIRLRARGISLRKVDVRVRGQLLKPNGRGCVQIPVGARMMMLSYRPDVTAYHLCQVRLSTRRSYIRFKLVAADDIPPANSDCSR